MVKPTVRLVEAHDKVVLSLDDMIGEKPYTDENLIVAWHYSHAKGRQVKGGESFNGNGTLWRY